MRDSSNRPTAPPDRQSPWAAIWNDAYEKADEVTVLLNNGDRLTGKARFAAPGITGLRLPDGRTAYISYFAIDGVIL